MRIGYALTTSTFTLALLMGGCAGSQDVDEPIDSAALDQLPDLENGKADGALSAPEKRPILLRMKKRLPEQRRLKAALLIGETVDGYVTVPPGASTLAAGSGEADAVKRFNDAENADRTAYYELVLRGHAREIRRGMEAAREEIREEVAAELCKELPPAVPCDQVAAAAIDAALEVAFEVSVDESLAPIRAEIERVHGRFWQSRTTREGEWIEVSDGQWKHKAAK